MRTIEQENVHTTPSSLSNLGKLRISEADNFFDDFSFGSGFSMNRNTSNAFSSNKTLDSLLSENTSKNPRYYTKTTLKIIINLFFVGINGL